MPLKRNRFPPGSATPYRQLRPQLRQGDILLCNGNGVFSAMIQMATKSIWSHVGFILRLDDVDRIMLLESVEPIGVRTVRLSKYLDDYDSNANPYFGGMVVIRHKLFNQQVQRKDLKTLTQFAVDQFGYPYDNAQIGKIAGRILTSFMRRKRPERFEDNKAFICSEYVSRCYDEAGFKVKWDPLGFIAPGDFAEAGTFEFVAIMKRP